MARRSRPSKKSADRIFSCALLFAVIALNACGLMAWYGWSMLT